MNKLWRNGGKVVGGVKMFIQNLLGSWKSEGFAHFLLKFCRGFYESYTRTFNLLFWKNKRFAHRTINTTIILIKGKE